MVPRALSHWEKSQQSSHRDLGPEGVISKLRNVSGLSRSSHVHHHLHHVRYLAVEIWSVCVHVKTTMLVHTSSVSL